MSQAQEAPPAPDVPRDPDALDGVSRELLVGITRRELKRLILPLGGGLLLWALIFRQEVVSAVRTWDASTAYNHCFLIIPIFLYMVWDRREGLLGLCARPTTRHLWIGLPLAAAWLVAERLGIMEGRQLVALSFAQLLFYAMLGRELYARMLGPFLYLYFLVPFGEFLTPRLQDITTVFTRYGLQIIGIPAYIDGYVIEIPQGVFLIAEACAGLRFLIASIAFGCLYAILMYRSPVRRGLFILASIVVPIIANGFRALGIVYLGYLLGSAQAAAADHVIYGWIFFSVVILILIAIGLPFRQDDQPYRQPDEWDAWIVGQVPFQHARMALSGLAVLATAGISPAIAGVISRAATVVPPVAETILPSAACLPIPGAEADPAHPNVRSQRVACGSFTMDLTWANFSPHATAAAVMAERRRLVQRAETEGLDENWLVTSDGKPSAWRLMHSNDPFFETAVSIWVDGKPVRPGMRTRIAMARNSLFGSAYAPMVMTVTPVADWDRVAGESRRAVQVMLPEFLARYPDLAQRVGEASAVK